MTMTFDPLAAALFVAAALFLLAALAQTRRP
jgi:hypothetical protein